MRPPRAAAPRRTLLAAAAPFALAALTACADDATAPDPEGSGPADLRPLVAAEQQAVRASNRFAFGLLRELAAADPGTNLVVSPYSATAALALTMNGAGGATRAEMQRVLGFGDVTTAQANATFQTLTRRLLGADPKVTIGVANAVWTSERFPLRAGFVDTARTFYDATARTVRFGTAEATRAINQWANDATRGRIPKVFEDGEPDADVATVLANALYFLGNWTTRFDPARTTPRPFTTGRGASVMVPTMSAAELPLRLGRDGALEIAELPYGDGAYAMTILLPPRGTSVESLARGLDAERWDALIGTLREAKMDVHLPKFTLQGRLDLVRPLAALGMRTPFDERVADFRPLSEGCLVGVVGRDCHISDVFQNVFIRVDEAGTEAAAVTVVVIRPTSLPPSVTVDRPFLFAIRERATGAVLFLGRITDPRG